MKRFTPLLLTALLFHAGVLVTPASACPGCKDSVGSDDAVATAGGGDPATPSGLPGGFNASIYLMLGGLFGTMGLVGWVVVRGIRTPSVRPGGFPVEKRPTAKTDEKNPE